MLQCLAVSLEHERSGTAVECESEHSKGQIYRVGHSIDLKEEREKFEPISCLWTVITSTPELPLSCISLRFVSKSGLTLKSSKTDSLTELT